MAKRFYGFDLSDIPLTHRRDRIEARPTKIVKTQSRRQACHFTQLVGASDVKLRDE